MAKVTNASNRSKLSKAAAKDAAKKTTSSGKGIGKTPSTDSRLSRIKSSTAKVSTSGKDVKGGAKVTGASTKSQLVGSSKPAPARSGPKLLAAGKPAPRPLWGPKSPAGKAPSSGLRASTKSFGVSGSKAEARASVPKAAPKPRFKGPTISSPVDGGSKAAKQLTAPSKVAKKAPATIGSIAKTAAKTLLTKAAPKAAGLASVAAAGLSASNTGDGTMKGKPTSGPQGPKNPNQGLTKAKSFDKAFKAARAAGKSTFSWNGKSYNTKKK